MNAPNLGTENPMTDKEILVERVARAIDPNAFRAWQSMFDYCIRQGDDAATAKDYADTADGDRLAKAREQASAAIEAIASMPHSEQVEGWQPIETAPRDGSKFLVTDGNDYDFGSWHRDHVCGELEGHAPFTLWAQMPALTRNVSDKE